jgi:hypothetical protein
VKQVPKSQPAKGIFGYQMSIAAPLRFRHRTKHGATAP